MYELLRAPSSPICGSENSVSKLLTPNGGLPLHNNTTLLFAAPPLFVQPTLPQSCKSDRLPSAPCVTPSKPSCGTKSDTLTGLTPNHVLVGTCEKSYDRSCGGNKPPQNQPVPPATPVTPTPNTISVVTGSGYGTTATPVIPVSPAKPVIPAPSNPLPKVELERKETCAKEEHHCGDKLPQSQPVIPAKPVIPAPSNPLPKVELERKETCAKEEHHCGDKLPQNQPVTPAKPVIPAPSNPLPKVELERKETCAKEEHHCGDKLPQNQPAKPVTPVTPAKPVVVTGSGYGTIV